MIPLNDYIMVKPDELKDEETTKTGIILNNQTQEKPESGVVLSVGNGGMVIAMGSGGARSARGMGGTGCPDGITPYGAGGGEISPLIAKGDRIYYKGYLMDIIDGVGFIKMEDILAKDEAST